MPILAGLGVGLATGGLSYLASKKASDAASGSMGAATALQTRRQLDTGTDQV